MVRRILWRDIAAAGQYFRAASSRFGSGGEIALHRHDFYEFFWVLEGSGTHLINGARENLEKDDLVIIRPEDLHRFRGSFSILNAALSPQATRELSTRYPRIASVFPVTPPGGESKPGRRYKLTSAQRSWLDSTVPRMQGAGSFEFDRFMLNFAALISGSPGSTALAGCPEWLKEACVLMMREENLKSGVTRLAQLAGRTPEHIARVMKACTGSTPHRYITGLKMDLAARKLTFRNDSILQVAYDCGYDSLSHFYSVFRRYHGTTPRRFKQKNRNILPGA